MANEMILLDIVFFPNLSVDVLLYWVGLECNGPINIIRFCRPGQFT